VVVFFQCQFGCGSCCGGGAGCAVSSWSLFLLLVHLGAVVCGSAGAGDGGGASGWRRPWERCSVGSPAMGVCSSGFGAAEAGAGDAGSVGMSGAVAGVTFVATGAGGTSDGAGCACGRAAVGRAVIWLIPGP